MPKVSNSGQFKKGSAPWNKGGSFSEESREKMRQAKLKNPTKYWTGKKRTIAKVVKKRNDGYRYIAYSLIEENIQVFFKKWGTRPVPEHHYVWVKHNKSEIPSKHVIHHVNHKKDDNRIENLMLLPWGDHSRLHNSKKRI